MAARSLVLVLLKEMKQNGSGKQKEKYLRNMIYRSGHGLHPFFNFLAYSSIDEFLVWGQEAAHAMAVSWLTPNLISLRG